MKQTKNLATCCKCNLWTGIKVLVCLGSLTAPSFAVVTSDEAGSHVTVPGDLAFGVDVDGVAVLAGEPFGGAQAIEDLLAPSCTAALITDRHVLTAAHCFDNDSDGVVDSGFIFPHVAAFELPDRTVMLSVNAAEGELPSARFPLEWPAIEADLAVVELADEAPSNIPRYSLYGGTNELGRRFVLVGYGATGLGATGQDPTFDAYPVKRAGLNRFEDDQGPEPGVNYLAYDFDSGLAENNALAQTGFESDLGFGSDEVLMGAGDSGSPNFLYGAIAGVSAFTMRLPAADVNAEDDASWGEGGFALRISDFRQFILDATDNLAIFIPDGDFDHDAHITAADIDLLSSEANSSEYEEEFDLNLDQVVGQEDRRIWVEGLVGTSFGDADLNGTVDFADFLVLSSTFGSPGGWADGDFDGNGAVAFADFLLLSSSFGKTTMSLATVPEPSGWIEFSFGLFGTAALGRLCRTKFSFHTTGGPHFV